MMMMTTWNMGTVFLIQWHLDTMALTLAACPDAQSRRVRRDVNGHTNGHTNGQTNKHTSTQTLNNYTTLTNI